ncbi:flavin reductase [uncultured Carboxylicivirga sp.]|uniref:flavin reductase n=1 Tax=Carboxylicivirga sp. M1479 TaxID=2594476 RepID=UPI0011779579|nr:High molecular weight rubredoxin [Carboxylicivirga sp. M1479]
MNIEAFFKLSYGLYIIATKNKDKLNAYIANTAFQVTAQPPQIAISCSKDNYTCGMIQSSKIFSISVLNQEAKSETIGLFGYKSGRDINKFENISYTTATTGAPIVKEDSIAWFDCRVNNMIDVGSHIVFIATIEDSDLLENKPPLTYAHYHEVKKGLAPKNAPTYIDEKVLNQSKSESTTKKYKCLACGYIYDPDLGDEENGIPPGTEFEGLPEDWLCPTCGSTKDMFDPI